MKKVKVLVIELLLGGNSIFKFNAEIEVGGPLLSKEKAEELVKGGYVSYVEEKLTKAQKEAEEKAKAAELEAQKEAEEKAKAAELEAQKNIQNDDSEEDPLGVKKQQTKK